MSHTHVVKKTVNIDGRELTTIQTTYTGGGSVSVSEAIPKASTDLALNVAIPLLGLKSLWIYSDAALTLETNDGTTPDDTISLAAGVPIDWQNDSPHDCPITSAVTILYATEGNVAAANLTIEALYDVTP